MFHGEREVFVSDHRDWCHANSIEGSCRVLSLAEYQATQLIQPTDFFCRFFYSPTTRTFRPDEVPVYCLCNSPYNPDVFMVECGTCYDWFHPRCVRMTEEEVEHIQTFTCPSCKEDGGGGGKKSEGPTEVEREELRLKVSALEEKLLIATGPTDWPLASPYWPLCSVPTIARWFPFLH